MRHPSEIAALAADAAAVTTVAFADVPGLGKAVKSGVAYKFKATLLWRSAAITTGARFAVNGPATPTLLAYTARWVGATDTTESLTYARAYDTGTASTGVVTANADYLAIVEGVIIPSAAGTLIPRVASEVAGSGITVRNGSNFEVIEL